MNYIENPKSFGEIPENSFVKHNRQLFKVTSGSNIQIVLVVPRLAEIKLLRDELAEKRDDSPDGWRRYNEIDSYYTWICISQAIKARSGPEVK